MAYWQLNINNQDSFPAKGSPVPITLTRHDESDYSTQEGKVQFSQSNDVIVQNNLSDTCNSDPDTLSVVSVYHDMDSTTCFQQEGSDPHSHTIERERERETERERERDRER